MNENRKENNTAHRAKLPTKLSLMVRVGVALYLFYTVYSLRDVFGKYSGGELVFFAGMMIVFLVVGIAICVFSVRDLIHGRYEGGASDADMTGEEESESEKQQEDGEK